MIVFCRKSYIEKFYLNNNLNENVIIAVNDITYNNNKLSLH